MSKVCPGGSGGAGWSWSHPSPLPGAAAVVCLGSDVLDAGDLEAGGLKAADRGLATGARALHEDLDLLHALLDALAGRRVRRHLGGERRGLARALEAGAAGGLPRDHVALLVGQGDDRVVEAGLDVRLAERDVLARLAAATAARWSLLRHYEITSEASVSACGELLPGVSANGVI